MKTLYLVVSMLTLASACFSSSYSPKESPQIARITLSGTEAYTRDGQTYRRVSAAVEGNAQASTAARAYERRTRLGTWISGLSGVCVVAGAGLASTSGGNTQKFGAGAAIGCVLGIGAGIYLGSSATGHRDDAINLYNDGLRLEDALSDKATPIVRLHLCPKGSGDCVATQEPSEFH